MKSIQVDEMVYAELEKRVRSFDETPNDVLRRVLDIANTNASTAAPKNIETGAARALIDFVLSNAYLIGDAKQRYFAVLRFLLTLDPKKFSQLEGFKRQKRVNISRSAQEIESSGNNTFPEKLSGTPYFVMTNLDNKSKRTVLNHALTLFGFGLSVKIAVENSIPDSDISRARVNRYI